MKTCSSFVVAALSLSMMMTLPACSQEEPAPQVSALPLRDATDPAVLAQTADAQRGSRLPQPDRSVPSAQYMTLESGNQIMYAYYALSGLPVDHAATAELISRDYRVSTNSFRKRDLLAALKPRIDASVAEAANSPYVRLDINGSSSLLSSYDFQRKGFLVKALEDASATRYFNDNSRYRIKFPNAEAFSMLPVTDEAQARKIEELLSKYETLVLRVHAFANDSDPAQQVVKATITRIVLTDNRGRQLAEFAPAR